MVAILPSVLGNPLIDHILIDESKQLEKGLLLDVLVGDGDDVTYIFSNRVLETGHIPVKKNRRDYTMSLSRTLIVAKRLENRYLAQAWLSWIQGLVRKDMTNWKHVLTWII